MSETNKEHAEHITRRLADGWYAIHFCRECQKEAKHEKHTPLPWRYVVCDAGGEDIQDAPYISIQEDTKVPIISTAQIGPPIDETDVANAKLIVTSVNAHERLEADSKKLREPATCNAGHKSNLPLALWDCPVCTQLLRDELEAYKRGDHPDQIHREEEMAAKNFDPIEFMESDGTERKLMYDRGDPSVGIAPGWQPDDNLVEDLRKRDKAALGGKAE